MKRSQPTAPAARRPYPGARLYTLVPTACENLDVVNAHRFPPAPPSVADVVRELNIRTKAAAAD